MTFPTRRTWAVEEEAWVDAETAANHFWDKKVYNRPNGGASFTWKQFTDAATTLAPRRVRTKDGTQGWILGGSRQWRSDEDFIEAREILKSASKTFPSKVITEEDVESFKTLVKGARQEYRFHYNYAISNACYDIIKPGTSLSDVISKIPPEEIDCIPRINLNSTIEYLIRIVNNVKKQELDLDFALSLPDLVEATTPMDDNLEKLEENEYVKTRNMPTHELEYMLLTYWQMVLTGSKSLCSYRDQIESERELMREQAKEARDSYRRLAFNPVQFLVYLEREWKYAIQHPVIEIAKLSAYFTDFDENPMTAFVGL